MDDLIVRFCEDRRSWLFVIAGTLALALVFALPYVDEYLAVCSEKSDVAEQLAVARQSAQLLGGYEARRAEQFKVLTQQRDTTLNQHNEADYRNQVVKLVRDSGCQLRRLNIGTPQARDWFDGDNPLERTATKKGKTTGFQLERRQVNLSLVGSSMSVRRLIEQFEQHDKLVHVQALELKPTGSDGRRVELSMELWYFTLARPAA